MRNAYVVPIYERRNAVRIPCLTLLIVWLIGAFCVGCGQTASVTKGVKSAPVLSAQTTKLTINKIQKNLEDYLGKEVTLKAAYGDPRRECTGIPYKRADWMIYDETSAMYVSGMGPAGLQRYGTGDWGTPLKVRGIVKQTKSGTPYISAIEVKVLDK
jgi:hypothetical protein